MQSPRKDILIVSSIAAAVIIGMIAESVLAFFGKISPPLLSYVVTTGIGALAGIARNDRQTDAEKKS